MSQSAQLVLFSSLSAITFSLVASITLVRRYREMQRHEIERIRALQQKIGAALQDGFNDKSTREAFTATLNTARLTTGLQLPRLQNMAKIDKPAPEKYKILGKMASQGMGAEEIATILGISPIEAGQLLSLSSMARMGQ